MKFFLAVLTLLIANIAFGQGRSASDEFGGKTGLGGRLRGVLTEVKSVVIQIPATDSTPAKTRTVRSLSPLTGGRVTLKGARFESLTDSAGKFYIQKIPRGVYDVYFSAKGYGSEMFKSVLFKPDTVTEIDMTLFPSLSSLNEQTVTVNQFEQPLSEQTASVIILDGEQVRSRGVAAADALRDVTGVSVNGYQAGVASADANNFRSDGNAKFLIDHIPLQAPDWPLHPLADFPFLGLEKIEILKAPASTLYGNGAVGGVANFILPNLFPTQTKVMFYGGVSDFSDGDAFFNRTKGLGGTEVLHTQTLGRLGLLLSAGYETDGGLNSAGTSKAYRSLYPLDSTVSFQSSQLLKFFSKITYAASDAVELGLLAGVSQTHIEGFSNLIEFQYPTDRTVFRLAPTATFALSRTSFFAVSGHLVHLDLAFPTNSTSLIAVDFPNTVSADDGGGKAHLVLDLDNGQFLSFGVDANVERLGGNGSQVTLGGYLQNEYWVVKSLRFQYGFRYSAYQASEQKLGDGKFKAIGSPRLAFNYEVNSFSHLRASVSSGFRLPSLEELFSSRYISGLPSSLQTSLPVPEKTTSYELGYKLLYTKPIHVVSGLDLTTLDLDAATFYTRYINRLISNRADDILLYPFVPFNYPTPINAVAFETTLNLSFNDNAVAVTASENIERADDGYANRTTLLSYVSLAANFGRYTVATDIHARLNHGYLKYDPPYTFANGTQTDVRFGVRLLQSVTADVMMKNIFQTGQALWLTVPSSSVRQIVLKVQTAF
jgi:outer membrane receptor protein involved in Fe transport